MACPSTRRSADCCHTGCGRPGRARHLYLAAGTTPSTSCSTLRPTTARPRQLVRQASRPTHDLAADPPLHPQPDGHHHSGRNLFRPALRTVRIYAMGCAILARLARFEDRWLYWGDVGPDASQDTANGPRGYDEHNQARGPGFFGWPYFVGENLAYPYYDFVKDQPLEKKDPNKPINTSVNNTGLRELPPAQPAFISYPYSSSEKLRWSARGPNRPSAPHLSRADSRQAPRRFPTTTKASAHSGSLARLDHRDDGWARRLRPCERSVGYNPIEPTTEV